MKALWEIKAPKPVVNIGKNSDLMIKLGEEHYGRITELANAAPDVPRSVWAQQQGNKKVAETGYKGRDAFIDNKGVHINIKQDVKGSDFKFQFANTKHESWHKE